MELGFQGPFSYRAGHIDLEVVHQHDQIGVCSTGGEGATNSRVFVSQVDDGVSD